MASYAIRPAKFQQILDEIYGVGVRAGASHDAELHAYAMGHVECVRKLLGSRLAQDVMEQYQKGVATSTSKLFKRMPDAVKPLDICDEDGSPAAGSKRRRVRAMPAPEPTPDFGIPGVPPNGDLS